MPLLLQATAPLAPAVLWLAAVAVVTAGLLVAFAVALLQRHHRPLARGFAFVDRQLSRYAGRPWQTAKRVLPGSWKHAALLGAGGLVVGGAVLFGAITDAWMDQEALYRIDQAVNRGLDGALTPAMERWIMRLTHLADLPVVAGVSAVLVLVFVVQRAWWRLLAFFLTMGVGEGLLWLLKWIFGRARPATRLYDPVGASFPSGHSFAAAILYGFLIYLLWRVTTNDAARALGTALLIAVILAIGTSRILLNVHWVSDVLGGLVIGLAWLVFSLLVTYVLRQRAMQT